MIRVLLADDQQLIREALPPLGLEVDPVIVGQVGSGDEVLGAVRLL